MISSMPYGPKWLNRKVATSAPMYPPLPTGGLGLMPGANL